MNTGSCLSVASGWAVVRASTLLVCRSSQDAIQQATES